MGVLFLRAIRAAAPCVCEKAGSAPVPRTDNVPDTNNQGVRHVQSHRIRARIRGNTTRAAYELEVATLSVEETDGARQAERDELAKACVAAVRGLPEPQGRAVQLAFLRGWTHEEIASAEGEPLGTVKARIRRGLLALRKTLKEYNG